MNEDFDYNSTAQKLGFAMRVIADLDLVGIIDTTETAHTIGPLTDPTKYREQLQRGDMDAVCDLARALLPAVKVWDEKIAPKLDSAA